MIARIIEFYSRIYANTENTKCQNGTSVAQHVIGHQIKVAMIFSCILLGGCSLYNQNQINTRSTLTFEQRQQDLIDKFGPPPPKGYQPIGPIPAQLCQAIIEVKEDANKKLQKQTQQAMSLYEGVDPDFGRHTQKSIHQCKKISWAKSSSVLQSLPSEAVRLAIGQVDKSGNIAFGPFAAKRKTGSYVVVLDYIKYQSNTMPIIVRDEVPRFFEYTGYDADQYNLLNVQIEEANARIKSLHPQAQPSDPVYDEVYRLRSTLDGIYFKYLATFLDAKPKWARNYSLQTFQGIQGSQDDSARYATPIYEDEIQTIFNIPIYIGVGVRMIASVTVNSEEVDLGSLYGLAAGAQSGKLQGTLVFQTLGLSGESISPMLPMPSEINVTTIQNAIQALATIKSKLYDGRDDGKVSVVPVVLGIDDTVGRAGSKEKIISKIQSESNALSLYIVDN